MRISDWSSDVCSSDLGALNHRVGCVGVHHVKHGVDDFVTADPQNRRSQDLLGLGRSAEHTSELQSLMRRSYADFCLKNNTHRTTLELGRQHVSTPVTH